MLLGEIASVITIFEFVSKLLNKTDSKSSDVLRDVISQNSSSSSKQIIQELLKNKNSDTPDYKIAEIVEYQDILHKTFNNKQFKQFYISNQLGYVINILLGQVEQKFEKYNCFEVFDPNNINDGRMFSPTTSLSNNIEGLPFTNLKLSLIENNFFPRSCKIKSNGDLYFTRNLSYKYLNNREMHCNFNFQGGICEAYYYRNMRGTLTSFFSSKNDEVEIQNNKITSKNFESIVEAIMLDAIFYLQNSIKENSKRLKILKKYKI